METQIKLPLPHKHQQRIIDSPARFRIVMAGRRGGKSLICHNISITTMLENQSVAYVTPTFSLAKVFFDELLETLPPEIVQRSNKSDLTIQLITGGRIDFFTAENLTPIRGRKFHLVIIDEAAFCKDLQDNYTKVIRPTLSDYQGKAIFISTPRGKDYFNSLYNKGLNKDDDYESFHFTSYDNPYLSKSEIDAAKEELPTAAFNQEYLAIPSENAANPFGMTLIKELVIPQLSTEPSVVFGIDLAKSSDYTVIVGLDKQGNQSYYERFQKDWTLTKEAIRKLPKSTRKLIDSTGVGDPIVEELQKEQSNIEGFKFTASSKPSLIMGLIKSMEDKLIHYIADMQDELEAFEYKLSPSGHTKYEAMTGFHDDKTIALALANSLYKKYFYKSPYRSGWSVHVAPAS